MEVTTFLRLGVALSLVLVGVWFGSHHVQAKWDAAQLQQERAARVLAAQQQRISHQQAIQREQARQALRNQLKEALNGLEADLSVPVACPASAPLRFGDVPVPAGVLDRVRNAGAGASTD